MWAHGVVEAVLEEMEMIKQYITHIALLHDRLSGLVVECPP